MYGYNSNKDKQSVWQQVQILSSIRQRHRMWRGIDLLGVNVGPLWQGGASIVVSWKFLCIRVAMLFQINTSQQKLSCNNKQTILNEKQQTLKEETLKKSQKSQRFQRENVSDADAEGLPYFQETKQIRNWQMPRLSWIMVSWSYLAVWWEGDVEVAYGILGEWPVVPGLLHKGQAATWLLSVVSDLQPQLSVRQCTGNIPLIGLSGDWVWSRSDHIVSWVLTLMKRANLFSLKAKKLKRWCCPLLVSGTRFPKQSA